MAQYGIGISNFLELLFKLEMHMLCFCVDITLNMGKLENIRFLDM